jgi:hypothetical protein
MGLFREIQRLTRSGCERTEDLVTEVLASVLRRNPALAQSWFQRIGIRNIDAASSIEIQTQDPQELLEHHATDSRIDMSVQIIGPGTRQLVFIESKVQSAQGLDQLQRYAELLARECDRTAAKGTLVFLTRDYEPADKPSVPGFDFDFIVTRWFRFHECLAALGGADGLEAELKTLLEEHRMSVGNRFRSTDLVALENFRVAKSLMDETLIEFGDNWRKILNKGGRIHRAIGQLRQHGRYCLYTRLTGFECVLGYWLPDPDSTEPVWVGITLYCDPKATARSEIVSAFRTWARDRPDAWSADDLDKDRAWASIYRGRTLNTFQGDSDQVAAIKAYFLSLIAELAEFRSKNPGLPWTPTEIPEEE